MERTIIHIIDSNSRSRAEQARIAFALGHHAEVYGGLEELLTHPPAEGILLVAEASAPDGACRLLDRLGKAGLWLPVVMTASECQVEDVVDAIRAGVLDYLPLPLEMGVFARRLHWILAEAGPQIEARRREVEARQLIDALSRREREVLEALAAGRSNKVIARDLGISPRTVEIHRANMMAKLDADHAADAVRLWISAQLDEHESELQEPEQEVGNVEVIRHPRPVEAGEFLEPRRQRQ